MDIKKILSNKKSIGAIAAVVIAVVILIVIFAISGGDSSDSEENSSNNSNNTQESSENLSEESTVEGENATLSADEKDAFNEARSAITDFNTVYSAGLGYVLFNSSEDDPAARQQAVEAELALLEVEFEKVSALSDVNNHPAVKKEYDQFGNSYYAYIDFALSVEDAEAAIAELGECGAELSGFDPTTDPSGATTAAQNYLTSISNCNNIVAGIGDLKVDQFNQSVDAVSALLRGLEDASNSFLEGSITEQNLKTIVDTEFGGYLTALNQIGEPTQEDDFEQALSELKSEYSVPQY